MAQQSDPDPEPEDAPKAAAQPAPDEVPLAKVYDLLTKKRLVADKQAAINLIQ